MQTLSPKVAPLVLFATVVLLVHTVAAKKPTNVNWAKLAWTHVRLDKAKQQAEEILNDDLVDALKTQTTNGLAETAAIPGKYTLVDFTSARYKPLCKAFFAKRDVDPKDNGQINRIATCSCAFVKPNLVALAAHCFTDINLTASSGRAVYVVQQFGRDHPGDHAAERRNYALEWWVPRDYKTEEKPQKNAGNGHDIAFIRTEAAAEGNLHYNLMLPEGKAGSKGTSYRLFYKGVQSLGYPDDYKSMQVPVAFEGTLLADDPPICPAVMVILQGKPIPNAPLKNNDMGRGGSGGPWILTDAALKDPNLKAVTNELKMGMFSVYSYGPLTEDATMDVVTRSGAGPRVTPDLLKVVDKINGFKSPLPPTAKAGEAGKTAAGDDATKVDAQTETVLFKII